MSLCKALFILYAVAVSWTLTFLIDVIEPATVKYILGVGIILILLDVYTEER